MSNFLGFPSLKYPLPASRCQVFISYKRAETPRSKVKCMGKTPSAVWNPLPSALLPSHRYSSIQPQAEGASVRSEEHTSELQSLMRISYAVFCLTKKNNTRYNI